MPQHDDFFREYFIQLRKECDAIRSEMNRFLNFAIIIVGAVGFAGVRKSTIPMGCHVTASRTTIRLVLRCGDSRGGLGLRDCCWQ